MGKSKPKTKKQLKNEFEKIEKYKWEFLRRNEDYILDCEKWSNRKRKQWSKEEIILCYKFEKNFDDILDVKNIQIMKNLINYFDQHSSEWSNLNATKESDVWLRKKGLNPPQTPRQYTWKPYEDKWEINLPLNPFCKLLPFFVNIAPADIVNEPIYGKLENDPFLEKGTSSLIWINWAMPKKRITHKINELFDLKRFLLESRGLIKDNRMRFDEYETYLKVWDLRKEKKTFRKIAKEVFPKDYKKEARKIEAVGKEIDEKERLFNKLYKKIGIDAAYKKVYGKESKTSNKIIQRVIDSFNAAKKLIEGGYKEIR